MVVLYIYHSDEAMRIGDVEFSFPALLGHEGAGIIEKVGEQATNFKVGDQVLMAYNTWGECENCNSENPSSCINWTTLNMSGARIDGTYTFKKQDGTAVSNFFT